MWTILTSILYTLCFLLTLRTSEAGIPALRNFPVASHAGIPALRKLPCSVGSRYTGGTVCQRQASDAGIPALFSNAYWHLNARVIEIQTRQQLKIICSVKPSKFLGTSFAFGHLAANVRVRCRDFFKVTCLCSIFESTSAICVWQAL